MAISAVSSTTSAATSSSAEAASQLSTDYEDFLILLTEQLQHQDPLDPMDTNEFTNQLVQYSQLEQQINTNGYLEGMSSSLSSSTIGQSLGYLGTTVEVSGDTAYSSGEGATWSYTLSQSSSDVVLQVLDASGAVVREESVSASAGDNDFSWDGLSDDGEALEAGYYSLNVSATDSDGEALTVDLTVHQQVSGVDTTGDGALLLLEGGAAANLDDVLSVAA